MRRQFALFTLLLLALTALGCAPATSQRSSELLAIDYRTLSDADLEQHYLELTDQIATAERQGRGGTSIGFGIGSSPVQVGVTQHLPSGTSTAEELRARRNEVRAELGRRGLR